MKNRLLPQFLRELWLCCRSVLGISVFWVLFVISGFAASYNLGKQEMPSHDVEKKCINSFPEKNRVDSLVLLCQQLTTDTKHCKDIVENYQADADLVIDKATDIVAIWLGISTALVAIIIGLSVWNNYKQEDSYKKNVEALKDDIKTVRREQEATARINKMGAIMTCMNSLPDPLLTDSDADRKKYVNTQLSLMYDEFAAYVKLVKEDVTIVSVDIRYLQLVLSALKICILRAQGVYSDRLSNLAFYMFSTKLNEAIRDIQTSSITHANVAERLTTLLEEFDKFRMELPR